jgi:hypothetical protein
MNHEESVWEKYLVSLPDEKLERVEELVAEIEGIGVLDEHKDRVWVSARDSIRNTPDQTNFTPVCRLEQHGWDVDWNWVEKNVDGFCAPAEYDEDEYDFW